MKQLKHSLCVACLTIMSAWSVGDTLVYENGTGVAHDQPYYTSDVGASRLIFTEQNKPSAEQAAGLQIPLQSLYEQSFGYHMDTRLDVGLMSSYNQIANGFSTQFPRNRQINYIGGALNPDYFASSSWLHTLLIHETAHNYQTNAKDNPVSKSLYSVFGNGALLTPIVPAITPNLFESSFILEGNAVLNESWHGLGGRLYSGRLRALANAQAKAGYLTRERLYNRTLYFPYAESFYVLGGFYHYYLAETYGLDRVNKYFKNRSRHWYWPFLVNAPMRKTLGINFNNSLADWAQAMREQAQPMQFAAGNIIAHSQFMSPINEQQGEIRFLVNPDGVSRPSLLTYNKSLGQLSQQQTGHRSGKVIMFEDDLYTVATGHTSVWRIYQGLLDDGGEVLKGSEGKVIQGYLADGRAVYFDVASSFENPQLHIGKDFYASVNSSVLVNGMDVYYCTQKGRQRTLYKNRQALYTFESHYGFPVDVDSAGRVYFIANSAYGSSLYRVSDRQVERVLAADNVIDARVTANDEALVAAVSADEYYYSLETLKPNREAPFVVSLLWDEKSSSSTPGDHQSVEVSGLAEVEPEPLTLDTPYGVFNNIRYSGGYLNLGATTEDDDNDDDDELHLLYSTGVSFSDPLTRSRYSLWALRNADLSTLVGVGFANNQTFLLTGLRAYYVAEDGFEDIPGDVTRDSGISAQLRVPFWRSGYWNAEVAGTYFEDYRLWEREPTAVELQLSRIERHGFSWLPNRELTLSGYSVEDRGDTINGGRLHLTHGFANELYLELGGKYADSDADFAANGSRRGVELSDDTNFINNDPSVFYMHSLKDDTYAERAAMGSIAVSKVFNGSAYYFNFPLSLRRESLLLGYRHFEFEGVANLGDVQIGQTVLGINLDLLLMNILPFNVALEAVYNDNDTITDRMAVQGRLGLSF